MNIYIDESYNLQKGKGKQFISINGFAVSVKDEKSLRRSWREVRKQYADKGRIHAHDSRFENLRQPSIRVLAEYQKGIFSAFQLINKLPYTYFGEDGMHFNTVYNELLKKLLDSVLPNYHPKIRIIIDTRKFKGGENAKEKSMTSIRSYVNRKFPNTQCEFEMTPSYLDILVELADFVSNSFYKEYLLGTDIISKKMGSQITQIGNPL